jgi:iron complex transport system permease protein
MNTRSKFLIGLALLIALAALHLFAGTTQLHWSDFYQAIVHYDNSNTHHVIARDLRVPRMLTALIAGAGLSLSGLLMQTIFNNPLAEPNILGVSTGSSLFVAITIMTGAHFFISDWGIISSALVGAFLFGLIILFFSKFIRSQASLLLFGIMLASFTGSFINIIQAWSDAHQLKLFTLWSMGSLQQVSFHQLPIFIIVFSTGMVLSFFLIKSLNAMVLGQQNASILGINVHNTRLLTIFVAAIQTGLITAFCGPIAFIGMAVPNLVKLVFKTQKHQLLIIGSTLFGAIFLLICDIIIQLLSNSFVLPLNAVTALIGAPFIIYILFKRWS